MLAEWEKLAREATAKNEPYEGYLLRLTEAEVTTRSANALAARIRNACFPVVKDFDTFDFTAIPSLSKQKVLELSRGEWVTVFGLYRRASPLRVPLSAPRVLPWDGLAQRHLGLEYLGRVEAETADKVKVLVAALADQQAIFEVINALEGYGKEAATALPMLKKLKLSPNDALREAARKAIEKIE